MELEKIHNQITLGYKYILTIEDSDLANMKQPDRFTRMLWDDCNSKDATIADKLLGLECLARLIESGR